MNDENKDAESQQSDTTTPEEQSQPAEQGPSTDQQDGASAKERFTEFTHKLASSTEKVIGASYEKAKSAVHSAKFEPQIGVRLLDRCLDWGRSVFPPEKFEGLSKWLVKYGHIGLVVTQIIGTLFFLIAAIKLSSWAFVAYAAGFFVLMSVLQYTANRFLNAGDSLIESSVSRLGSAAFLDCLALLMEIAGLLIFLRYLMLAQWSFFWVGLGIWAFCDAIAYIALNPRMANIVVEPGVRAGEEAIGIMSFFVKALVRVVPIAFGIGTILGGLGVLFGTFSLLRSSTIAGGVAALRLTVLSACLPFASYVFFAFYHLTIDILRAILMIPGKLDGLAGRAGEDNTGS